MWARITEQEVLILDHRAELLFQYNRLRLTFSQPKLTEDPMSLYFLSVFVYLQSRNAGIMAIACHHFLAIHPCYSRDHDILCFNLLPAADQRCLNLPCFLR